METPTPKHPVMERRTLLKAMAGLPFLGAFALAWANKTSLDTRKNTRLLQALGLSPGSGTVPPIFPSSNPNSNSNRSVLRLGMIGFGSRANDQAKALGFVHPDRAEAMKKDGTWENYMLQENLNVVIAGICEVFDQRAENGLAIAKAKTGPAASTQSDLPVKRYRTYQEMLDDKDIDAVIIATPDHHHAPISIAAARAGKHVYCEKSVALNEEELNELYRTIKETNCIYQLGHQIPQNVVFQQARQIIDRKLLGKITHVETTTNRNSADGAWIRHLDANGNPKPGDEKSIDWAQWLGSKPYVPFSIDRYYNWTKFFDYDTGLIGQLFSHEYDAVNQLLHIGIPKSAMASGGIYYWKDNREMADTLHVVFEYPQHDLTLTYSGNLANSRNRGRYFMGNDGSMELGASLRLTADGESKRYQKLKQEGILPEDGPMLYYKPGSSGVDAVTSATAQYYADRGLDRTYVNGREVDILHLHLREWLNCIRYGGTPSANIEMAFEEGITSIMAHRSYVEKRRVEWDAENRKIV